MSLTQKKLFGLPLGRYDTEQYFRFVFICCNIRYQLSIARYVSHEEENATNCHILVDEELGLIHTPTRTISIQNRWTWTSTRCWLFRVSEIKSNQFLTQLQASDYTEGMIKWSNPPIEYRTRQQEELIESWREYCEVQDPDPNFSTG